MTVQTKKKAFLLLILLAGFVIVLLYMVKIYYPIYDSPVIREVASSVKVTGIIRQYQADTDELGFFISNVNSSNGKVYPYLTLMFESTPDQDLSVGLCVQVKGNISLNNEPSILVSEMAFLGYHDCRNDLPIYDHIGLFNQEIDLEGLVLNKPRTSLEQDFDHIFKVPELVDSPEGILLKAQNWEVLKQLDAYTGQNVKLYGQAGPDYTGNSPVFVVTKVVTEE